jgi:hypothetical protein
MNNLFQARAQESAKEGEFQIIYILLGKKKKNTRWNIHGQKYLDRKSINVNKLLTQLVDLSVKMRSIGNCIYNDNQQ